MARRAPQPEAPSDESILEIIGTITGLQALFVGLPAGSDELLAQAEAEAKRRGLL